MNNKYDNTTGVSRNSAAYGKSKLSVVIDANGEVGAVFLSDLASSAVPHEIEMMIAGTFTGTIALQCAPIDTALSDNDKWVTVESYTAPAAQIVTCAAPQAIRLKATAWTSGTAYTSLIGALSAEDKR